jgi:hypothetical protein
MDSSHPPQPEARDAGASLPGDTSAQTAPQTAPQVESGSATSWQPLAATGRCLRWVARPVLHLSTKQWVWLGAAIVLTGAAGVQAVKLLLDVPELPDCWTVYLSNSSASAQLYCAEKLANRRTIEDMQRAIGLVNNLPTDDGLRDKGKQLSEQWSLELLNLSEQAFQAGNLERALKGMGAIPPESRSFAAAQEQSQQWQASWDRAEALYQQADAKINQKKWAEAMATARGLLRIGNTYWETTRYQELMEQLELARGNRNSKDAPERAQAKSKQTVFDQSQSYLSRLRQQEDATLAARFSKARALARSGDLAGLQAAIAEAEPVMYGSGRFEEMQQAVNLWKQQVEAIEDRPSLDRAVALAQKGDAVSLQAAIDEAYQIYPGRALYDEARDRINQWTSQLYGQQDRDLNLQTQQLLEDTRYSIPSRTSPSPSPMPAVDTTPPSSATSPQPLPDFQPPANLPSAPPGQRF